jgi:hypothetical protein
MQLTETTGLLPFSQQPASFLCSEPDESNPLCSAVSPEDPFKCCAQCTRRSSKWSLAFRFSNQNPVCVSFFPPCVPHGPPMLPSMSLLNHCSVITLTFGTVSSELLNSSLNNLPTNEKLNAEITDSRSA